MTTKIAHDDGPGATRLSHQDVIRFTLIVTWVGSAIVLLLPR